MAVSKLPAMGRQLDASGEHVSLTKVHDLMVGPLTSRFGAKLYKRTVLRKK